jgi:hypothetical protein
VMLAVMFRLMWWTLNDSAAAKYDYQRDYLNDEEWWWYRFTGALYLPVALMTLGFMVFIMGPAQILLSMHLLPEPGSYSAQARLITGMPLFNILLTGFIAWSQWGMLMNIATRQPRGSVR